MASSSSSSASRSWKYDVFISFRGEDTRKNFVDHLYYALQQHAILTYKDDVTLDRGDTIGPALKSAIRESHIALIIFSENYANSSWCLDELSYIMECKEDSGQVVLPIFYHVDPSDVRKQKRKYGEAFAEHELSENNKNKVELWKKALVDASNIAGWETKHVANGHEARCIQEIVRSILDKFPYLDSLVDDENLVGMETRLQKLRSHLSIGSGGVRMVGIWGLGGTGKTTLATSLYMKLKSSGQFHGCCFVGNIREASKQQHGLKGLQEKILSTVFNKQMQVESVELGKHEINKMLCSRNVLIVLDDVDHLEQLEALAGCHNWFGNGSRIIITTRDKQVLESRVDEVCPVSLLSNDEAIRLFKRHAYRQHNPVEDYEKLSLQVITYCNHLPLALKILGAFLYGKDLDEWISTLARLKDHPEMGIVEKLKISYDGLTPVEKELFLDIACFHKGTDKKAAMKILDACGFYSAIGVKVLIQKALITVSVNGNFDIHDLVAEMAHYIVKGEHPNNPEKHSRIWRQEDIEDICSRNATMENDKIEAIQCDVSRSFNFITLVSNMKKLRFLKVRTTLFGEGPSFLSNELRYIDWLGYPASPFPESFQPRKLLVLRMSESLQKELWKGYKYLPFLKELDLSWMALVRAPDIGGLPCLQKLILYQCIRLEEIHQSLGNHSSLVHVSVSYCDNLTRFPSIVQMKKLEILKISCCKALVEFPKIEANMDSLVELYMWEVSIEILPSTIQEYCTNLTSLSVEDCSELKSIDGNFHALKGLQRFSLRGCKKLEKFPKGVYNKNLDGHGLRKLYLGYCGLKDGEIPKEVGELSSLQELYLYMNDFTRLDFSLSRLTSLKLLKLSRCENLVELPELPSSLAILYAFDCKSLEVIKDDAHRRCKWLCKVLILGRRKNISGGERLLETMLQGMAVESRCMILQLNDGSGIARGFEPRMIRGRTCRMQLPENWYNHFYGFLFYAASKGSLGYYSSISMKHVKKSVSDSQDDNDVYLEEEEITFDNVNYTWVTYLPFSLLRHTSWWDPTSIAIHVEFDKRINIKYCGLKLVPSPPLLQMGAAAAAASSSSDKDDDYKCELRILHDSKSAFKFQVEHTGWF